MRILFTSPEGFREHMLSVIDAVLAFALARRGHEVVACAAARAGDPEEENMQGVTVRREMGQRAAERAAEFFSIEEWGRRMTQCYRFAAFGEPLPKPMDASVFRGTPAAKD